MATKHLRINGRVQGVSFRAWTCQRARELGVSGWVRNQPDGSVEALVSGTGDAVEALIAALHQGPPAAEVEQVRARDAETEVETGFEIRH